MRLIDADAFNELLDNAEIEAVKNRKYVFASAINVVRGNLANMPNIDPCQYQWIPVSERLPEICEKDVNGMVTFSKQVWACLEYGDGFFWQAIDQYTSFGGWLSEPPVDDPADRCKVIAWMPLPEPYKGE